MTVSVTRIDSDSTTMSRPSTRATLTPDALATSGSKVVKSNCRYRKNTTAPAKTMTAMSHTICAFVIPRMLPKSALSNAGPEEPNLLNRATPRANDAVVTTPMAASAPKRLRRATAVMAMAEAMPHSPAPST